jgi:hypothetical protein
VRRAGFAQGLRRAAHYAFGVRDTNAYDRHVRIVISLMLIACGTTSDTARPDPLAPLPPPAPVKTDRFVDAETCAQCHLIGDASPVLHDATGANVSPVLLWRSSMMGLAARDPYYLAAFSEELAAGADRASTEKLCTRCHGPAGAEETAAANHHIGFDELVAGTDPAALLARGGVTCTACHQIGASNLGDETSFNGGFTIGYGRALYGRYTDPLVSPMQLIVNYTPTLGAHITSSALCGTCHTVIVGGLAEQATYLEWRSSGFVGKNVQCADCHVPTVDDLGAPIATAIASYPSGIAARQPVGKHVFVGGNSYMLSVLADAVDWSGANVDASELVAASNRDAAHLATAAKLSVVDAHREGTTAVVTIRVENQTGHKLPTGYPSRRMWLHVTARSGSSIVFESGATDATGALVDAAGTPLPAQPHRDVIEAGDEVQVWEAQMVDAKGTPTHRALAATGYGKDDRILPMGWAPKATDAGRVASFGTAGDTSFVAGADDVTYRIANAAANVALAIDLSYQSTRPDIVDALDAARTPAGTKFSDLARARPDVPVVIAHVDATVP